MFEAMDSTRRPASSPLELTTAAMIAAKGCRRPSGCDANAGPWLLPTARAWWRAWRCAAQDPVIPSVFRRLSTHETASLRADHNDIGNATCIRSIARPGINFRTAAHVDARSEGQAGGRDATRSDVAASDLHKRRPSARSPRAISPVDSRSIAGFASARSPSCASADSCASWRPRSKTSRSATA